MHDFGGEIGGGFGVEWSEDGGGGDLEGVALGGADEMVGWVGGVDEGEDEGGSRRGGGEGGARDELEALFVVGDDERLEFWEGDGEGAEGGPG